MSNSVEHYNKMIALVTESEYHDPLKLDKTKWPEDADEPCKACGMNPCYWSNHR